MPTISVIIPVYNSQKYLKRCIESVLSQTFTDFELILVDDGSPDDCGKICDTYASFDSRIFVLHQENCGVSIARNNGLFSSHGSYVAYIDSDDYVEKEYLSELYALIKQYNAEISIVDAFPYENDNYPSLNGETTVYCNGRQAVQEIGIKHSYKFRCCWGKLVKQEIAKAYPFPSGKKIGEDFAVVYKWLFSANLVAEKGISLYHYNKENEESATHHFQLKNLDELCVDEMLVFFKENDFPELLKMYAEEYVMRTAIYADTIKKEYSKENRILRQLQRKLRKAIWAYGTLIGLKSSSQKNFIMRTAYPTIYQIKRNIKKLKNILKYH